MNVLLAAAAIALLTAVQPLRPRPNPAHASHTGTLMVRWTVGGRASPDACEQVRAATVDIDVRGESFSDVATLTLPCGAFAATAALPEGNYWVLAVPEDDRGRPVSVPMHDRVAIEAGSSKVVSFNFPSSALAGDAPGGGRTPRR